MEGKLKLVLMLFVVSEAAPQRPHPPPHNDGQGPPPHEYFGPPMHNHGRHLERHRPLPDRPLNIGPPFYDDNNPLSRRRFDNHHSRFDHNQQRIHHGPPHRPIDPFNDYNGDINTEALEQANNKENEKNKIVQGREVTGATTKIAFARIKEGLKEDIANLKTIAKYGLSNTRNKQNSLTTTSSIKIDESTRNTLITTTSKIRDAGNKKSERVVEAKLDSLNTVDSDLLDQIFGSAEDESSTTESTTEYETTTWDDFNRIGAPPAVVASLLG